jgi:hypothetical protein
MLEIMPIALHYNSLCHRLYDEESDQEWQNDRLHNQHLVGHIVPETISTVL